MFFSLHFPLFLNHFSFFLPTVCRLGFLLFGFHVSLANERHSKRWRYGKKEVMVFSLSLGTCLRTDVFYMWITFPFQHIMPNHCTWNGWVLIYYNNIPHKFIYDLGMFLWQNSLMTVQSSWILFVLSWMASSRSS